MIKLPEKLNTDNVLPLISLLYKENKDYVKTYNTIVRDIISLGNNAGSLLYTFPTLMTYELIKQKAPVEEFDLLLNHLENNLTLKKIFKNFFNQDTDINLADYKKAKENNINDIGYTIWDEISFVFLDYCPTKKVHLSSEKKPYLHSFLNKVTQENCDLKEFFSLFYLPILLTNNTTDIAYILQNYPDIAHKFIVSLSEMDSSKMSINHMKDIINTFKENIEDFDKYFYNLIFHNYSENCVTFKPDDYLNLIKIIGEEEFIIKLSSHIQTYFSRCFNVKKDYERALKFCLNLKKGLKDVDIDVGNININLKKSFIDNCIPIILLECQIEQSYDIKICVNTANYLLKEINSIEENNSWNFAIKFDFDLLKQYAQYILLEKALSHKNNEIKTNKKKI